MSALPPSASATVPADWRPGLPTLAGSMVDLRDMSIADAPWLLAALSAADVARFISPPATDLEGFERFITSMHRKRAAGGCACFAIVPRGLDRPIGVFQVRALTPDFATAEWGFALASDFWGTGMFVDGAQLALAFAFDVIGVERLEARAAAANGRGNGALRKIGAVFEAVLRRSFLRNGAYHDQALWTILREEWRDAKAIWGSRGVLH